jgi:hypothetical protein
LAVVTPNRLLNRELAMWARLLKLFYLIAAAGSLLSSVWMLAAPHSWYTDFPGGIPDTGPYNQHFVRDLGVVFAVCALGLAWCAFNLARCFPVHLGITAFMIGHALVHVADLVTGRLPPHHWWMDTPGVFVPAAALGLLSLPLWRLQGNPAPLRG